VYPLVDISHVLVYGYDSRPEEGIKPPHHDRWYHDARSYSW